MRGLLKILIVIAGVVLAAAVVMIAWLWPQTQQMPEAAQQVSDTPVEQQVPETETAQDVVEEVVAEQPPEEPVTEQHPEEPPVEEPVAEQHPEEPPVQEPVTEQPPEQPPVEEPEPSEETTQAATQQAQPDDLAQQVQQICTPQLGQWDVCIEPLSEGEAVRYATSPDTPMVSASVIKLFVMAAVYDQVKQGVLEHETVYPLIYPMITVSDNYCTNELIRLLGGGDAAAGMEAVNGYAASIGCTSSCLQRLMLEDNGLQNYTTAADCARLLRMIYEGRCVSAPWSKQMLQILQEQTVVNRIPAGLPQDVVCANKTGDLIGLCVADVGIVFGEQGDYILCAICTPDDDYRAGLAITQLSKTVYEALN